MRVACVATTFNSTFDLLLLWKNFFPVNENRRTVDRERYAVAVKRTRQLLGVYIYTSEVGACLLAVPEKRRRHDRKEGWRARYLTRTHSYNCTRD